LKRANTRFRRISSKLLVLNEVIRIGLVSVKNDKDGGTGNVVHNTVKKHSMLFLHRGWPVHALLPFGEPAN
jgi:hypothetical protein